MKILALELSSPQGSIAWCEAEEESFEVRFANDRKDSGVFFESLRRCLQRVGQPERIVVGLGPGSYAGTRIAIATATGLAAAAGARLRDVPSVSAMNTETNEYVVIGDARRESFYFAQVRERCCVDGPLLFGAPELRGRLTNIGMPVLATQTLALFPEAQIAQPSALILAQIAAQSSGGIADEPLEPIYLRAPHITSPKAAH